ncbi:MAG: response regulator [Kofleriaceae bacterium]
MSEPAAPPRILIVDDSLDVAELLGEFLERAGYAVRIADCGDAALDGLAQFTPELALLDLGLPGMDGYELAGELRARVPAIKLAALTGYGLPSDRERTRAAGFDLHLVKPVSIGKLTHEIEQLLR